jgi:hypothetical protein
MAVADEATPQPAAGRRKDRAWFAPSGPPLARWRAGGRRNVMGAIYRKGGAMRGYIGMLAILVTVSLGCDGADQRGTVPGRSDSETATTPDLERGTTAPAQPGAEAGIPPLGPESGPGMPGDTTGDPATGAGLTPP